MEAAADLTAALAAVRSVAARFHTASDDELLADVAMVEQMGRMVDGLRLSGAAEVEHRSRKTLGEEPSPSATAPGTASSWSGTSRVSRIGRRGCGSGSAPPSPPGSG